MEHTEIVSAAELEAFADRIASESIIPELISWLVKESVADLHELRIPYGDGVNQIGWDGLVETTNGFRNCVPRGKSYWEIGTGSSPQKKATKDFKKRTRQMTDAERANASYVFVTPRSGGGSGWDEPRQSKWRRRYSQFGWQEVRIIDGTRLAEWLREFPSIGAWLAKKMGLTKSIAGFWTPASHWENLLQLRRMGDPPLLPKVFLVGRDQAVTELLRLFRGDISGLVLAGESALDGMDFIAAFLASLDADTSRSFSTKCLFLDQDEAWLSMATLKRSHVLVAHPKLDLESGGERLHLEARKNGHSVIFQASFAMGSGNVLRISSPSASVLESTLLDCGYSPARAKEAASAGALSLEGLKRHLRGIDGPPPYATGPNARALSIAGLIGRWGGEKAEDRAVLEDLLGKSYGEWIETVRTETLRPGTPLTQRNENWKIISRQEAWKALGPFVFNEDLDRLQKVALNVLGESDPRFDLPPEERYAASLHGKLRKYSSSLRQGIAETLALLGSHPEGLSSCSTGRAELVAVQTVRELLKNAGWIRWASLTDVLPLLAEAAPDEFLDAVEAALDKPAESPLGELFKQESSGLTGSNYMTGLLWALETLAWNADHLTRVTVILGQLAEIDPGGNWANRPGNSLTTIFLPWLPQTCASVSKRLASVSALLKEHPGVGWKLLLRLLPSSHEVSSGSRKPAWRDYIPLDRPQNVPMKEYVEQVIAFSEITVRVAATDLARLAELIDRLQDLPEQAQQSVLDHLSSEAVRSLPDSSRVSLWEALVDLATKHRKFADAGWAMKEGKIQEIEAAAAKLKPIAPIFSYRRLFSERDFDLMSEKGDYEEQRQRLDTQRQEAVTEIVKDVGIEGILSFAQAVASPWQVGLALGIVGYPAVDDAILPKYLRCSEKSLEQLTGGFVWGRLRTKGWEWVDSLRAQSWSEEQKGEFLSRLPFERKTWQRAELLLKGDQSAYWNRVTPNPYEAKEEVVEAVEQLLKHNRPRAGVQCLERAVHERIEVSPSIVIRVLKANLVSEEPSGTFDQYACSELIEWLQTTQDTDENDLFQIEWSYLPLLDHHYGGTPKALENRLSKDPAFFCELIRAVFRSKHEDMPKEEPSEAIKKIAENAYRLLHKWQLPPGSEIGGEFNEEVFYSWLAAVKQSTQESGHLGVAMSQVGSVLAYAPPDSDGLWIHHSVAEALNAKDAADMRSGFTCELFNKRGAHWSTTENAGNEERKLAVHYQEKAEALEQKGYHRLATAVRELAKGYERDAEWVSSRHALED